MLIIKGIKELLSEAPSGQNLRVKIFTFIKLVKLAIKIRLISSDFTLKLKSILSFT